MRKQHLLLRGLLLWLPLTLACQPAQRSQGTADAGHIEDAGLATDAAHSTDAPPPDLGDPYTEPDQRDAQTTDGGPEGADAVEDAPGQADMRGADVDEADLVDMEPVVDLGIDSEDAGLDQADQEVSGPTPPPEGYQVDRCQEVAAFGPVYAEAIARWGRMDDLAAPPPGGLLMVGSSSVRRWEGFAQAFAPYSPIQRGFGGGQLGEVALYAQELVTRHDPAVVLVFAGTNDIAAQVSPEVTLERLACLRQRIGEALGWDRPVGLVGITPTPARWASWSRADAFNQGAQRMAAQDPGLFYIDAPARFLLTGAPPDEALFVQDRLHLSALGYQLWRQVIQEQLRGLIEPVAPPAAQALPAGTRLLLDLGPTDGREGEPSPSPDHLGQHWNNWPEMASGQGALAGEHLDHLVTSQGEPTQVSVTLTGGFLCNGWSQGGLRWPQAQELGDLAVGSATGDFFYTTPQDSTGGLWLRGLDPQRRYTLRLFASREHDQRRVTQYSAHHAGGVQSVTLQTSGPGASAASTGNRAQVASLTDLAPDERGGLFVDVQLLEGDYGYLSVLELRVQ